MIKNKKIAVVVPAYNEQKQIGMVIDTMPDYVDKIIVVNDCSRDGTEDILRRHIPGNSKPEIPVIEAETITPNKYNRADIVVHEMTQKEHEYYISSRVLNADPENDRVIVINNLRNGGVGAAIARGYKWALDHRMDCTAVMAGDGQMDPAELESITEPVLNGEVDYVKGNRLIHRSAWLVIPKIRYFGNSILSIFTKVASGYWRVSDPQCGYTAISLKALQSIRIHDIYRGYGMPNDLLVKLNIAFCTIKEVEIKPVYQIGEQSKMNVFKVIPNISLLLLRLFFQRLWVKYLFRDFHPLFLLYNFSFLLGIIMIPYLVKITNLIVTGRKISYETLLIFIFLAISSFQSLFFAMWMDMQDNDRLIK